LANGKHRVSSPEEAYHWIAQHGGQIDEKWRNQELVNEKCDAMMIKVFDRIDTLTTRIAWMTGAAAALGAVIGIAAQAFGGHR